MNTGIILLNALMVVLWVACVIDYVVIYNRRPYVRVFVSLVFWLFIASTFITFPLTWRVIVAGSVVLWGACIDVPRTLRRARADGKQGSVSRADMWDAFHCLLYICVVLLTYVTVALW